MLSHELNLFFKNTKISHFLLLTFDFLLKTLIS